MAPPDQSSARPANLMKYSRVMTEWDEQTHGMLGAVQRAVAAWNNAPVPHLQEPGGAQDHDPIAAAHTALKSWWAKDDWVARVAVAFTDADRGQCSPIQGTAQDFAAAASLAKVVKTDNSMLAAVGLTDENRAIDYLDLSQADRLADQAAKAYDPAQLKQILARLPYNDPNALEFVTRFYNDLGARNILNLAGRLHGDEGALKVLGESFATATNSPQFNHRIVSDMGREIDPNDHFDERKAFYNLLHYGTYSQEFLGMAIDKGWLKWNDPPHPEVLQALARNPNAAAYLMSHPYAYANPDGSQRTVEPYSRLFADLRLNHSLDDSSLDGAAAALIKSSTEGEFGGVNRSNLASMVARGEVDDMPDSVRKAIADMAAAHIDEIGQRHDALDFYKHLTKDHEDIAVGLAQAALKQHAAANFPHLRPGESDQEFLNDLRAWAQNEGTYQPAIFQALRANGLEEAEAKARSWEWKWFAGEVILESGIMAIPGAGEEEAAATITAKIASWGKEAGTDASRGGLLHYLEDKVKPDFTGTALEHADATEKQIKTGQITQLTTLLYARGQIGTGGDMPPDQYLDKVINTYISSYKPGNADEANQHLRDLGMSEKQISALEGTLDGFISHEDPSMQGGN